MKRFSLWMALVLTILLPGCSTQSSQRHLSVLAKGGLPTSDRIFPRRFGEAGGGATCASTAEQDTRLRQDYLQTLEACRYVLSGYETDSLEAKREKRILMIVGALAGSVIVPTLAAGNAAKSAIAGWGGLSGAMNVASHSMESEGLDAAYFLSTRENVRSALDQAIKKFVNQNSDYCERRNAVEEMAAACTAYVTQLPPEKK